MKRQRWWELGRTAAAAGCLVGTGAIGGCSAPAVCAPGSTQECVCPGELRGAQVCALSGSTWEPCTCSTPTSAPEPPRVCTPGESRSCSCAAGTEGSQVCAQDGALWLECICPALPQEPDEATPKKEVAAARAGEPRSSAKRDNSVAPGPRPYLVRVRTAQLAATKPDGRDWDGAGDGPADPYVTVVVQGAGIGSLRTEIAKNTLSPAWQKVERMTINVGDSLAITVVDADAFDDDLIVRRTVLFAGPKKYRIAAPESSLISLEIDVEPASL